MKIYYIRYAEHATVHIEGRIEGYHQEKLDSLFRELLEIKCFRNILNFEKTIYISSTIIASIIEQWRKCKDKDGQLVVCSLSNNVDQVFEITNLSTKISVFKTEKDAEREINDIVIM